MNYTNSRTVGFRTESRFVLHYKKGGESIRNYSKESRYELYTRDKHATISVLTFRQQDLPAQDEYIERVQMEYKVEWFKEMSSDFQAEARQILKELNVQFHLRGRNKVLECLQFGGNREFWNDFPDKEEIESYFSHCYDYAVKTIGFMGTDKNIICAITVTETNRRNLFVYYLPITEQWRVKAMSNNRSEKGNKLQQRDEYGYPMYIAQRDISKPLLCHSEFWKQRGGGRSYSTLQENFYNEISKRYGAKRGESTSRLKYTTPEQTERFCRVAGDTNDTLPPIKGIWI